MRPWSYSRLGTYSDCPKQYWYSYVEKMDGFRPPSPAANRGSDIHSKAEAYLRGEVAMYPPELQKVSGHAMGLKAKGATAEQKLAVKEDWTPCDYAAPEAYFRGIVDVSYIDGISVHIQDWKTGQIYPDHAKQMETYVALVAPYHPEAEAFITRLVYVDQGLITPPKVTKREKLIPIRMLIDGEIKNAETDEIYPVRSGKACKWCDYSQKYGGPCPH